MVFILLKREDLRIRRQGTGFFYRGRNMDHLNNFPETMGVPYARQIGAPLCFKTALSDQRDLWLSSILLRRLSFERSVA